MIIYRPSFRANDLKSLGRCSRTVAHFLDLQNAINGPLKKKSSTPQSRLVKQDPLSDYSAAKGPGIPDVRSLPVSYLAIRGKTVGKPCPESNLPD